MALPESGAETGAEVVEVAAPGTPFLSVIVATYNGESTLARALESLARQSYPRNRYEVIVVDDGSSQELAPVVEPFDVRFLRLPQNRGGAAARNAGLALARGEIVVCLDDDCVADPDWLVHLAAGFTRAGRDGLGHPDDLAGVGGVLVSSVVRRGLVARYFASNELGAPPTSSNDPSHSPARRLLDYLAHNGRAASTTADAVEVSELYGANAALRADVLRAVGGWDETMRGIEDTDLCRRIVRAGGATRFLSVSAAKVSHEPRMTFTKMVRRSLDRGPVRLRYYRRNGFLPPIFPFPILILLATVGLTVVSGIVPGSVCVALLPQLLYHWWWRRAWSERSAVPLAFPYLQAIEEGATVAGMLRGYLGVGVPAGERVYSPLRSRVTRLLAQTRIGVTAAERRAHQDGEQVWLSFDDYGTPAQLQRVLDVLAAERVRAMFFLSGDWAERNPGLIDRIAAGGHVLGNHCYTHRDLLTLTPRERATEFANGVQGPLLRPPMGRYDRAVRSEARSLGMDIAYWSVDSDDWKGVSEDYIYAKVIGESRPGSVVLFHLHADSTVSVLPRVIDGLRRERLTLAGDGPDCLAAPPEPRLGLVGRGRRLLGRMAGDTLSRNAAFLMASTGVMSLLGFVFWVFVAHLYSSDDLGVASAVVSISVLVSSASMLGLDVGLIRFLPTSRTPGADVNAAMIFVGVVAMLASAVYAVSGTTLGSKLPFFTQNSGTVLLFSFLLAVVALNSLTDSVFIARRRAHYHTIAYAVFGLVRLVLAFALVGSGALGIFLAYTTAGTAALLLSLYYMRRGCGYVFRTRPDFSVLPRIRRFATDNYLAALVAQAPARILPTVIVARLGGTSSAYFAMAMTIANLIFIVPGALQQSLLAEGANDESRQLRDGWRAAKLLLALVVPMVIVAVVAAPYVLRVFGSDYSRGSATILQLLAVSGIFVGISALGTSMLNIQQRSRWNTVIQTVAAAVTLALAYALLSWGLTGVGMAFLVGSVVGAVAHLLVQVRYFRSARGSQPLHAGERSAVPASESTIA